MNRTMQSQESHAKALLVPGAHARLSARLRFRARGGLLLFVCTAPLAMSLACCTPPCPDRYLCQEQLVERYNANAAKAPRLLAKAAIYVHLVDDKGRSFDWGSTLLTPTSFLVLQKSENPLAPPDFVLIGQEAGNIELFRLGTSTADGLYYLWTNVGQHASGMHGHTALAGAPGAAAIPINPLDLASVLAITELPQDFSQPPTVLLRVNDKPGQCAYVLTCIDRQPVTRKIVARRDIYFNWDGDANRPIRPFRVDLLDEVGRPAMTATLKDYKPIRIAGEETPESEWPVMPTSIEIVWPKTGSRINVRLENPNTKTVDPDLFLFWERMPGAVRKNLTCVDPQPSTMPASR